MSLSSPQEGKRERERVNTPVSFIVVVDKTKMSCLIWYPFTVAATYRFTARCSNACTYILKACILTERDKRNVRYNCYSLHLAEFIQNGFELFFPLSRTFFPSLPCSHCYSSFDYFPGNNTPSGPSSAHKIDQCNLPDVAPSVSAKFRACKSVTLVV